MNQKSGWHNHKEGGNSSGQIFEQARNLNFGKEANREFSELALSWSNAINKDKELGETEFKQLLEPFFARLSWDKKDASFNNGFLLMCLAITEDVLKRPLTDEEETEFTVVFKSFL